MKWTTFIALLGCAACHSSGEDGAKRSGGVLAEGPEPTKAAPTVTIETTPKTKDLDKAFDIEESRPADLDKAFDIEETKPTDVTSTKINPTPTKTKSPGKNPGVPGVAEPYSPPPLDTP